MRFLLWAAFHDHPRTYEPFQLSPLTGLVADELPNLSMDLALVLARDKPDGGFPS